MLKLSSYSRLNLALALNKSAGMGSQLGKFLAKPMASESLGFYAKRPLNAILSAARPAGLNVPAYRQSVKMVGRVPEAFRMETRTMPTPVNQPLVNMSLKDTVKHLNRGTLNRAVGEFDYPEITYPARRFAAAQAPALPSSVPPAHAQIMDQRSRLAAALRLARDDFRAAPSPAYYSQKMNEYL